MGIPESISFYTDQLKDHHCRLVAVSKTYPAAAIQEAYEAGHRDFGENKVQELVEKWEVLPRDIRWHLIGHLQTNKVKYIAPFVAMIHSVDSLKLLETINKEAKKNNRVIPCLLQIYIASEDTKFGFSPQEAKELIVSKECASLQHVHIAGLMGMASNTTDMSKVTQEFRGLKSLFEALKTSARDLPNIGLSELSMGMSNDYKIAVAEGSTMVRIGTAIFGTRSYPA